MGEPGGGEDWLAVLDALLAGDRVAFAKLGRLVSGCLAGLRAYDFRGDWDDLRQEVLLAVVANARAGRLRDPQALVGYVRIITRNKFFDRLKRADRQRERDTLAWEDEAARAASGPDPAAEAARHELWAAVAELPDEQRRLLEGIYRQGASYQEMADACGLPLGTLKRHLAQALAALRARLGGAGGP